MLQESIDVGHRDLIHVSKPGIEVQAKQDQLVRDMMQEVIYEKSRSFGGR